MTRTAAAGPRRPRSASSGSKPAGTVNVVDLTLMIAVVAGVLVAVVVLVGVLKSRRQEDEELFDVSQAQHETQHQLGENLGPPGDHHVSLPKLDGEATYEAIDDLRSHPEG
jgi:hypothetical protein